MKVRAFAPANISCIFKPILGDNAMHTGSLGLGFTLNEGVISEVQISDKTEIYFNNILINFKTVESVIKFFSPTKTISIRLTSPLQLGCGFGLSGASAIASAYALNQLLDLRKTNLELAKIAHSAEVKNKTGLGDVTNQYFGGCILKLKPSYMFEVEKIALEGVLVYCRVFGKLDTKSVITDSLLLKRVSLVSEQILKSLNSSMSFADIITLSKKFAVKSGLLKNEMLIEMIKQIEGKGGHASMVMLGQAIFSDVPFPGASRYVISNTAATLL